ncbi:MAG: LamG-like jellyroll fold domain-containing protein, partial [Chloroflexota bacterium]
MSSSLRFHRLQTVNHNGTVLVFGESTGESGLRKDQAHKLWYKVLDLAQVADAENPNAWDDNTRWTDWMSIPYPDEMRDVAMSLLTVRQTIDDSLHTQLRHWRVISDGSDLFLFRALDLATAKQWEASPVLLTAPPKGGANKKPAKSGLTAETTTIRVYANRFTVQRDVSPTAGTNRAATGKAITVPQLKLRSESRYRRSTMRETPQSDIDGQGFLDMRNEIFREPTMEFSMVTPIDGLFTMTLAPSSTPGRKRWQFFWKESPEEIAALSLLQDEDGWVDLEDKYDQFNTNQNLYRLSPDQVFKITHPESKKPLELIGQPDSIMYRAQEETTGATGNKEQMVSPERILLAARFKGDKGENQVVVDFGLDDHGMAEITETIAIDTINFARTALKLNGQTDQVLLPASVPDIAKTMTFSAWVRHNEGEGVLVHRGLDLSDATSSGFMIEWQPGAKKLVATLGMPAKAKATSSSTSGTANAPATKPTEDSTGRRVIVEAVLPTSHTWHHIALVVTASKASLYIDGAEAGLTEADLADFKASGETNIGGASIGASEKNWLDFDIDQVMLWKDARPPSLDTIYLELNVGALTKKDKDALLGCWQMDDAHNGNPDETADSSTHGRHAQIIGADHINQTAPIFKPSIGSIEDNLSGLSVGMGLVSIPKSRLADDPTLFLSSDGLVHVYTNVETDDNPGGELVALQYDTTSTRTQFQFDWQATVEKTGNKEEGELIFTARTPGPIMNRTNITVKDEGQSITLNIKNLHLSLEETWTNLPRQTDHIVAIINGQASADPTDEAVKKGEQIYYSYADNVRHNKKPLSGVKVGQKMVPVASPSFMAAQDVIPKNGALPLIVTKPAQAKMRQQGNFGGWIHAPVAVSGQFGPRQDTTPVAGRVDLANDKLMMLSTPSDFALEAWVKPDVIDRSELSSGTVVESRIINLKGETDTARYAMGLQSAWSLELSGNTSIHHKNDSPQIFDADTGDRDLINDKGQKLKDDKGDVKQEHYNESFALGLRFATPTNENQVGSLCQLVSRRGGGHMFYVEVDFDGIWFKMIDENHQARGVYAPFNVGRGETVTVACVWDIALETLPKTDDHPKIDQDSAGFMRLYINGSQRSSVFAKSMRYAKIEYINLGAPVFNDEVCDDIKNRIKDLRKWFKEDKDPADRGDRDVNVGPHFDQGCGLAIQAVYVWDFALDESDLVEPLAKRHRKLDWEFSKVTVATPAKPKNATPVATVKNEGTMDKAASWNLNFLPDDLKSGYRLFAAAGERQVFSNAQISAQSWSHLSAVCTGNHALSFTPTLQQRAIIKDSGGLSSDKSFTIDCTVRWQGGTGTQYILSKSDITQTDLAFQLGMRDNGKAFLRFVITNASGDPVTREVDSDFTLIKGNSYHLMARCALNDLAFQDNPSDPASSRWQLWQLDARLWAFDLDKGRWHSAAPLDMPLNRRDLEDARNRRDRINSYGGRTGYKTIIFVSDKNRSNSKIGLKQSPATASIGSLSGDGDTADDRAQGWFNGLIGNLRFWNKSLDDAALKKLAVTAGVPPGIPTPEANWEFEENRGLLALDAVGSMTATLTDETMWTVDRLTSQLGLTINGRTASVEFGGDGQAVDYGVVEQLSFGALPSQQGQTTILLVGDQDNSVGEPLSKVGYTMATARTGTEAVTWLKQATNQADAIVIDTVSLGTSGAYMARDMREALQPSLATGKETPLAVVQDNLTPEQIERLEESGVTAFFDPDEVLEDLVAWLGRHAQNLTYSKMVRGQIDDIRIWNDLRTQEEIYDNRNVILGGNEDNLVGYWPISTASGKLIKDASGHGNHAALNLDSTVDVRAFWAASDAPLGNELPQIRNLLDGPKTASTTQNGLSNGAAEYGDTQVTPEGSIQAVMKRVQVFLDGQGRCLTYTGFKVGDLDLFYIGQAQSDPTLIGYIEGAPPLPSENHTRPYYNSAFSYSSYSGSSAVQLNEAENTVQVYSAKSNRGFDQNWDIEFGPVVAVEGAMGFALGAFNAFTTQGIDVWGTIAASFSNSYDYLTEGGAQIGNTHTLTNRLAAHGDWEVGDDLANHDMGRRYEFKNMGYALVKSGVANIYSMKMRKTGTLMGITMIPDPEIKEDFNIIMFEMDPTYTKQGTLDGKIGFANDKDWPAADQERGSYFKPKEVNNLVKQIDAYEAKIAANYNDFNAGKLGRREQGAHFQKDDPAQNAKNLIGDNLEMPYDWDARVSKRNIVNTYVWTAEGGFFTEQQQTSVIRTESSGGAYGFKGQAGVKAKALIVPFTVGYVFDIKALFGGHINTTVMKTKQDGANFGLDISLNCEAFLKKYTNNPDRYYEPDDQPGKVDAYRFKTFYLVPEKDHFRTFWNRVVSRKWLESDNPNARALRAAQGNLNQVWRVLHRVTYVSRVPPTGERPVSTGEKPTRAVIHQIPNRGVIDLVLDVMRTGKTSKGEQIGGLGHKEQVGEAVTDVIDNQWALSVPWWQGYMDAAEAEPGGQLFAELKDTKQAVYEYMLAYFETGEADDDPRLTAPP